MRFLIFIFLGLSSLCNYILFVGTLRHKLDFIGFTKFHFIANVALLIAYFIFYQSEKRTPHVPSAFYGVLMSCFFPVFGFVFACFLVFWSSRRINRQLAQVEGSKASFRRRVTDRDLKEESSEFDPNEEWDNLEERSYLTKDSVYLQRIDEAEVLAEEKGGAKNWRLLGDAYLDYAQSSQLERERREKVLIAAKEAYEKSLSRFFDQKDTLVSYLKTCLLLEQYEAGLQAIEKAKNEGDLISEVVFLHSQILYQKGEIEKSLAILEKIKDKRFSQKAYQEVASFWKEGKG